MEEISVNENIVIKNLVITSRTEASEFQALHGFPIYKTKKFTLGVDKDLNKLCFDTEFIEEFTKWKELNPPIATYKVVKFNLPYFSKYFGKYEKSLTDDVEIQETEYNHPFRIGAIIKCKLDTQLMICELLE